MQRQRKDKGTDGEKGKVKNPNESGKKTEGDAPKRKGKKQEQRKGHRGRRQQEVLTVLGLRTASVREQRLPYGPMPTRQAWSFDSGVAVSVVPRDVKRLNAQLTFDHSKRSETKKRQGVRGARGFSLVWRLSVNILVQVTKLVLKPELMVARC